ncbi:MAG: hypothetical protein Q9162_005720 [Coniocarpon cinnabarinum]
MGADANERHPDYHNALARAVFKGDIAIVRVLADAGAKVDVYGPVGGDDTLLWVIVVQLTFMKRHWRIMKMLLDAGAHPDFENASLRPLEWLAMRRNRKKGYSIKEAPQFDCNTYQRGLAVGGHTMRTRLHNYISRFSAFHMGIVDDG